MAENNTLKKDAMIERLRNDGYTPRENGLLGLLKRRNASMYAVEGVGTVLMIPGIGTEAMQHVSHYLTDNGALEGALMSIADERVVGLIIDEEMGLAISTRLKLPFHGMVTRERYEEELAVCERGGSKQSMTQADLARARAYVVRLNEFPDEALLMPPTVPQPALNYLVEQGYSMGMYDEPGVVYDGALILRKENLDTFMQHHGVCVEDLREPAMDTVELAELEARRAAERRK